MKFKNATVGLLVFSISIGTAIAPDVVYADVQPLGQSIQAVESVPDAQTVLAFADLASNIKLQNLQVGSTVNDVILPSSLVVTLSDGLETTIHGVAWNINKPFDSDSVGTFSFTPVLSSAHIIAPEATLPVITVNVNKAETTLLGLRYEITETAGNSIEDVLRIQPAFGRLLYLQNYNTALKRWETKSVYTLSDTLTQDLSIYYPKLWYTSKEITTLWRFYAPETEAGSSYLSPVVTINALRVYQNPLGYYQILPSVALRSNAGYILRYGSMGLKVAYVQRKLGMGYIWEIIGPSTYAKIKAYQQSKGLVQTGAVDYSLWKRMGFSDYSWFYRGAYVSPMRTDLSSTKGQLVEAFIANAYRYLGTEYVVGAAGEPKTGIDCSGLVMQSMYATGVDPYPISVIRHSQPGYEYESRNFWASPQMKTVAISQRVRGDLIFYQNRAGTVIHVAIYLGNNRVIEAVPSGVRIANIITIYPSIKGVKRVFN